jgi:hypothetical protein
MGIKMECKKIQDLLPEFISGNIQQERKGEIQQHLSTCPSCQMEYEQLQEIWQKLADLPQEKPGPQLRPRFYTMLEAYKQGMQQSHKKTRWWENVSRWLSNLYPQKPALQFGVAVAFLVIGLFAGQWLQLGGNEQIVQLRDEVRQMRQMVMLSMLQQQSPSDRLKGVSWSYQMEQADPQVVNALIETLNQDPNVNVRLAAADALVLFLDYPSVKQSLIQSLLSQKSPLVQIELIDILVRLREKGSVQAFEKILQQKGLHNEVRQRARWGLQQLG